MDRADAEHRDRVLRDYFEARNWDENGEFSLVRELVARSSELLPEYPLVVDHEWEVRPGSTAGGRGDLIFFDGDHGFAVVEVKVVEGAAGSRTSRRNKVERQSLRYAEALGERYPGASVRALVFSDDGLYTGLRPAAVRRRGRVLGGDGPLLPI